MSEQDKVATAESVAKVFAEALLRNVRLEAERRNGASRKFEFAWSSREVRAHEQQTIEEFRVCWSEYCEEYR